MTDTDARLIERLRGHTPGPWNVQRDGQVWSDDHPVAEKITTGPWGDEGVNFITGERSLVHHWGAVATDEAKANAQLIAAAPTLLDRIESLTAEVARLREALRPFASAADLQTTSADDATGMIRVSYLRAARAALGDNK